MVCRSSELRCVAGGFVWWYSKRAMVPRRQPPRGTPWALLLAALLACAPPRMAPSSAPGHARTLVLYDDTGPYAWLGELYAAGAGVLASHFGSWRPTAISAYQRGAMSGFDAAVYIGSSYGQPLPQGFIDDVMAGKTRVVWVAQNLWQLAQRTPDFDARYGFRPGPVDRGPFHAVTYKGVRLARAADAAEGLTAIDAIAPDTVKVLARAERDDGSSVPWAVRSGHLTYVAENPMAYVTPGDRFLAFSDLLFDALAPSTPPRHRAVVRIEDVTARSSPAALRAVADALSARRVPFAIALIPVYVNPRSGERLSIADAPEVLEALHYMLDHGGTLVLHGYTHQYEIEKNPFSGVTGDDFEFYRAHVDASGVVLDGPVPGDSAAWAEDRVSRGLEEVTRAGLPRPGVFEYPHYAGSPVDSRAIARKIDIAFQRETIFAGALRGKDEDTSRSLGLPLPYVVDDLYGWSVVPENLGNYAPTSILGRAPETPELIVERARSLLVVRDGVAGFFFHPIYDRSILERIVDDITALGYTFVSVESLSASSATAARASRGPHAAR